MKQNRKFSLQSVPALAWFLALALLCTAAGSGLAQKRRSTGAKKPAARTPTPTPPPAVNLTAEAEAVGEQIKLVTRFIYIYGKIANGLELSEEQVRRGEVSQTVADKNRQSRDAVVANLKNLRAGLENIVQRFQANPRLQVQYLKMSQATDPVLQAERLAAAGRYDEAGKSLVQTVERLTEVMQALR